MLQIETNNSTQGFYTQLSQNMDSESDDEELVRFKSTDARPHKTHPILAATRNEDLYLTNQSVIENNNNANGGTGCPLDGDTVAILNQATNSTNHDDEVILMPRKPMSPARKACFLLSIFVCFASVITFLWILPCNDDMVCPISHSSLEPSHNWVRDYEKIEFKGIISVTNGLRGRGKNLIFMYRGDKLFAEFDESTHRHNGIIGIIGTRGQVGWYDQMADEPNSIDCGLIDVDKNGSPDCLVIDEYGQLGCINPISGQWMWHINLYLENTTDTKARRKAVDLLDFPLNLPDLNHDGINDLLLVTSLEDIQHNNLLFVSGANGQSIGKAISMRNCDFIHKLKLDDEFNLFFNCLNNDTELMKYQPLETIFKSATGRKLITDHLEPPSHLEQHKFYGQRRHTKSQRNIYSNEGVDLIIENSGKCPKNCTMSMNIVYQGTTFNVIQGTNMYGMVPAVLATKARGKQRPIVGFVVKFWEWLDEKQPPTNGSRRSTRSTFVDKIAIRKSKWTIPMSKETRRKRNATADIKRELRRVKEHVILIMLNGSTHRIINTSQSDVHVFCQENTGMDEICQPDMNYQENSVAIADLDDDGYQELVSYYSTFVQDTTKKDQWKLVTYCQQFRLEAELMSLYDTG